MLQREFELPSKFTQWMEIYAYSLVQPELSQAQLAADLNTSQATVQRAIAFMRSPIRTIQISGLPIF